jgi:hypothetical protein
MTGDFADKSAARQWVWDRLVAEDVARFRFPPHGRIPNFAGAEVAAARLFDIEPWKNATAIKVNPDSPQRPLSRGAASWHHRLRTDAEIARRLQEARSAPYSARQGRRGRKLVARRPLVRGGSPQSIRSSEPIMFYGVSPRMALQASSLSCILASVGSTSAIRPRADGTGDRLCSPSILNCSLPHQSPPCCKPWRLPTS